MEKFRPQALIFDLDGTLFKAEILTVPAFQMTFEQLREEGLYAGDIPPAERFLENVGALLSEIWARVLPNHSHETRERANVLLLEYQMKLLRDGVGELYEGVEETLKNLHDQGYKLFVASNGVEDYVKVVVQNMGLSPLFTAIYSAGEFQTQSKVELVRRLVETYRIESAWMCGDRLSDVEAGVQNGLYVVGCNYGDFHAERELQNADVVITSFTNLPDCLPS
jgi:phosphoglycolate phosphatase